MRFESRICRAMALLIPLGFASCSSKQEFPAQPIPTALTFPQAATLARDYLQQHDVTLSGYIVSERKQPDGWWLYYQTPFNAAARPTSLSYLIQVHDDGTVTELR